MLIVIHGPSLAGSGSQNSGRDETPRVEPRTSISTWYYERGSTVVPRNAPGTAFF